jgi:multidrug efflux pump subunit AcrB
MIVSYFLAQTFVPVMANWIMKVKHHKKQDGSANDRFRRICSLRPQQKIKTSKKKHFIAEIPTNMAKSAI